MIILSRNNNQWKAHVTHHYVFVMMSLTPSKSVFRFLTDNYRIFVTLLTVKGYAKGLVYSWIALSCGLSNQLWYCTIWFILYEIGNDKNPYTLLDYKSSLSLLRTRTSSQSFPTKVKKLAGFLPHWSMCMRKEKTR